MCISMHRLHRFLKKKTTKKIHNERNIRQLGKYLLTCNSYLAASITLLNLNFFKICILKWNFIYVFFPVFPKMLLKFHHMLFTTQPHHPESAWRLSKYSINVVVMNTWENFSKLQNSLLKNKRPSLSFFQFCYKFTSGFWNSSIYLSPKSWHGKTKGEGYEQKTGKWHKGEPDCLYAISLPLYGFFSHPRMRRPNVKENVKAS